MKQLLILLFFYSLVNFQESLAQTLSSSKFSYEGNTADFIQKLEKYVALDTNLRIEYINTEKNEIIISGIYEPSNNGLNATIFDILKPYISYHIEITCKGNECSYNFKNIMYYFKSSYGDVSSLPAKFLDEVEIELNEIINNKSQFIIDKSFEYSMESTEERMNSFKRVADDKNQKKSIRKKNLKLYNEYVIKNKVYKKIKSDIGIMFSKTYLQLTKL